MSNSDTNGESIIRITGLNKWFGTLHVLRDIDLEVVQQRAHRHLRSVGVGQSRR